MSNKAKQVALEAETLADTVVKKDGSKLITVKGSLSEVFTQALNTVFAKPNSLTGEYVAMESQAIDMVHLKRAQAAASGVGEDNVIRVGGHQHPQTVSPDQSSSDHYTIYGVNKLAVKPEDIVDVKSELSKLDPDERANFALVVNYCTPSHFSPDATGEPKEYMLNLQTALESMVEDMGGKVYKSLDACMESIIDDGTAYGNVAMEGILDSIREIFSRKNTLTKKDLGWMTRVEQGVIDKIKKTFANPSWVAKNIKPVHQIKVNPKIMRGLIVNGKVAEPSQAIATRGQMFVKNYDARINEIKAFDQAQKKALAEIEAFYRKNPKDAKTVDNFARQVISKIKVPESTSVIKDIQARHKSDAAAVQQASGAINSMTKEQVVSAANEALKYLNLSNSRGQKPTTIILGSDFEEGFFQDNGSYEGEILRTGPVGDFFNEQGNTADLTNYILSGYASYMSESLYSALALMAKSTKTETDLIENQPAQESVVGDLKKMLKEWKKKSDDAWNKMTPEEQKAFAFLAGGPSSGLNGVNANNAAKAQHAMHHGF